MSDKPQKPVRDPREANLCAEVGGFLFSHPCGMFAGNQCNRCGKPVCNQHLITMGTEGLCTACSKLSPEQQPDQRWQDPSWWDHVDVDTHNNRPTWYRRKRDGRQHFFIGDFTDHDEGVFASDREGGGEWEDDMGAS